MNVALPADGVIDVMQDDLRGVLRRRLKLDSFVGMAQPCPPGALMGHVHDLCLTRFGLPQARRWRLLRGRRPVLCGRTGRDGRSRDLRLPRGALCLQVADERGRYRLRLGLE